MEEEIQVYSLNEKFIIREKAVTPSFQEPKQGWKVLSERVKEVQCHHVELHLL